MNNLREDYETSPLIEKFLTYKLVVQGRSNKTVSEYHLDLRLFFRYLIATREHIDIYGEEFDKIDISIVDEEFVKNVTTASIYDFMVYLSRERRVQTSGRARKLSAIKAFFKYCTAVLKIVDKNPASEIEGPKKKKALPKFLTLDESVELLESVYNDPNNHNKERDYCILTLFLNCGMRLSELVSINLTDIDKNMRSLRVIGKGNKERIVYLNEACKSALSDYMKIRAGLTKEVKEKNALFISRNHNRISPKTVQWLVYKYLGEAGLNYKHMSTHKLRHTAATLMYQEGGVDVLALKEILGHEQLSTTQIYTHVNNKQLEEAVESNPLSRVRKNTRKEEDTNEE